MRVHRILKSAVLVLALGASPALAQTFPGHQSTVKYQLPTVGGPQGFGNHARITSSIQYNAGTQTYTIRDTGSAAITSSFGPADIVGAETNATYTVYRKTSGATTETFRLFNQGAGNPVIQLTYATFGAWRKSTVGATSTAVSDTYVVFGTKTASADLPVAGSAVYTTAIDGTFINKTAVYAVSGAGSLTANFGSSTISFGVTPVGTPSSGPVINFGAINGSGSITTKSSSFKANGSNGTYSMDMAGYFYGPGADEVGATFRLNGNGGNGNGALVGD